MKLGPSERVEEKDCWGVVKDDKPAVGGANAKIRSCSFRELENVDLIGGEVVEGAMGLREGNHEPWKLTEEVARELWE